MGVYLIQSTEVLRDDCVEDAIIVASNRNEAIKRFREELKFINEMNETPGLQVYNPEYFQVTRVDKKDKAVFLRYSDNSSFVEVADDYDPFFHPKLKAYQLSMDSTDAMSIVWATTYNKARAQYEEDGDGKSIWYTQDLSPFGDYTDVRARRVPKLDGYDNAKPEDIIKILVKEYGWQSDVINEGNVDEMMKKPSEEWF
ncbi:hypothetical protein [uncultured Lactobacillus sp.]|uniref:hypothetical protein n=1 Tax=uncultured Lactobacillus sp. TaxID=153152 RepID=UPI0026186B1A|nr:hypothetical protein [uncultured Lactobacillus sp.]